MIVEYLQIKILSKRIDLELFVFDLCATQSGWKQRFFFEGHLLGK